MIKKFLLIIPMLILYASGIMAQQKEVSGKVYNESNEAMVGVTVVVKGTTTGTTTQVDGSYTIKVSPDAVLLFSFVGYNTQEIPVAGKTVIDVTLTSSVSSLEEVVVTALGIKREKKALGYAVQDVKAEDLTSSGDANIANALQSKVAGVVINQSGAGVGGTSRIEIRGASSLSDNNQPLIIVDGIPFNSSDASNAGIWGGVESAGGLSDINPQDIENISVLKGPNAAALYGSRAGNGVILITTKKGASKGLNVNYNGNFAFSNLGYTLDLQEKYGQGSEGVYDKFGTASWGPLMNGQMLESWKGEEIPFSAQTGRIEDFVQTAYSQNHNISLSGGNDKGSIRVSASKSNENGLYEGHKVDKTNLDLKAAYQVNSWLSVDAKASYFNSKGEQRPEMGYYSFISYFNTMPMNIRSADLAPGYIINQAGNHQEILYTTANANYRNPYFMREQIYNNDERYRGFGYLGTNIQFTDALKLRLKYGIDFYREGLSNGYKYADNVSSIRPDYNTEERFFKEENYEFLLSYNKDFEDLTLSVNMGGNRMYTQSQSLLSRSGKLPTEGYYFLGYGTNITSAQAFSEQEVQSLYGFAQVGYKDMVYFDATARNDWSSTLPVENNSYFYPSFGISGLISEMYDLPDWFTFAKVRGSWAQVGKAADPYAIDESFTISTWNYNLLNGNVKSVLVNKDLKPEISSSFELGTDLRFLNNRIGLDFTYYNENTTNQILRVPTDQSTGYSEKLINAGRISNKGIEIMLNTTPVKKSDFTFEMNFNFAKNTTLLEDLDNDLKVYSFGGLNNSVDVIGIEGEKMGDIRGSVYKRDASGRIIAGADGLPMRQDSLVTIGNIQADFTGSVLLKATYKGFYVGALISMQQGGEIFSATEAAATSAGNSLRTTENDRMSFFFDGPLEDGSLNTTMVTAQQYWTRVASINEEFIYDASYMKLREITLGYNLPQKMLKKLNKEPIKSARIAVFGRNLFYFYKHTPGTVPDASAYSNSYAAQAFDFAPVPATRTFGISLDVAF